MLAFELCTCDNKQVQFQKDAFKHLYRITLIVQINTITVSFIYQRPQTSETAR
jgi:hypothetical protein